MVAYNFKSQFAPKVESGEKLHTIRGIGKRQHAKPGDSLQLYTGQRTTACRKLLDTICTETLPVKISIPENLEFPKTIWAYPIEITIGDRVLSDDEAIALAIADGFDSIDDFAEFFSDRLPFEGVLIKWQPPQ